MSFPVGGITHSESAAVEDLQPQTITMSHPEVIASFVSRSENSVPSQSTAPVGGVSLSVSAASAPVGDRQL
jgi:hypothetical protein